MSRIRWFDASENIEHDLPDLQTVLFGIGIDTKWQARERRTTIDCVKTFKTET